MRILMLAQFYPPTIGGEERHVRSLGVALAARGHDVAVATLWRAGLPEFEVDQGVPVYRIRGTMSRLVSLFVETERRHAPPFPDPEASLALRRIIERERPAVVHAHNWLVHSFLPLKAWSGARLVMTLHDYSLRCATKRLMYHDAPCSGPRPLKCLACAAGHYGPVKGAPIVLMNWAMGHAERRMVDRFLPVSEATARGSGLPGSGLPYQVIPNFVPDDVGEPSAAPDPRLALLPAEPFLLFVGDLTPAKGVDVLLRAYAGLADAPPLVLIGRASAQTPSALPPGVRLFESWPHAAVMGAWHRALLGLAPSIWPDPCPTVAMEAMATGRPVVAAQSGGLVDIVADGETGLLVPPGDPIALRAALARLLAEPGLRQAMGAAATRRAALFQARTVVPRIEQVYESVTADDAEVRGRWSVASRR